jgi:hypothetical protein
MHRTRTLAHLAAVAAFATAASVNVVLAFSGPDLVTCHMGGTSPESGFMNYGEANGVRAFAVMAFACNEGDQGVRWDDELPEPDNTHPIIATNMFRLRNGRIEQIGQAWVKHGGAAGQSDWCTKCQPGGNSELLGVGCCDVYGTVLNGNQFGLGPKSEINAANGSFPFPFCSPGDGGMNCPPANTTLATRRLQAKTSDLDASPGVLYFIEVQYITSDDATLANPRSDFNNASHRRISINEQGNLLAWQSDTALYEPGIKAWKLNGLGAGVIDPNVQEVNIDVTNDGRFWIAAKATDLGGGLWQYEYAIQNLNSDRSAQAFHVPISAGTTISEIGFHDVDYHSGEPYSLTDWTPTTTDTEVQWNTQTFAENPNANALRWGTMYNFRFVANIPPSSGQVTLDLFKPGTPTSVSATTIVPSEPLPAVTPSQTQAGLKTLYYALSTPTILPDFNTLEAYLGETVAQVDYPPTFGPFAGSGLESDVGAVFEGYVAIPQDGIYTFFTESDDGSKLYVDGVTVVNNDGAHPLLEMSGTANLLAGLHKIRVEYFEAGGSAALITRYQGPGLLKQVIPPGVLFRNIPADVNDTGSVDVDDLLTVINEWGVCKVPPAACDGDITANGSVDVDDLLEVINNWG